MNLLEIRGLHKRYKGGTEALGGIDLAVAPGELLAILGPSGSGKSTLLRVIAGLEPPTSGELFLAGRSLDGLSPRERDLAMVFQDSTLFPHRNVFENMAFGLRARSTPGGEIRERVGTVAGRLGLSGLLMEPPSRLSGGQKQRVALGRALVRRPALFLLDEPFSGLDGPLRVDLQNELAGLHRDLDAAMILVTHDQDEAMALGDRIAILRSGRLVQIGTPRDLYEDPADSFVAGFLGNPPMSLLRGEWHSEGGHRKFGVASRPGDALIELPIGEDAPPLPDMRAGRQLLLGIRPEQVRPDAEGPRAEVVHTGWMGSRQIVGLRLGSQPIRMTRPTGEGYEPGQGIGLAIDWGGVCWFDAETGGRLGRGG